MHAELFTVQHKFKALLIMGWGCLPLIHPFLPLKSNFVDESGNVLKWSMNGSCVPKRTMYRNGHVPIWLLVTPSVHSISVHDNFGTV